MARVLSMVIAIVASVLVFAASVLAVAALLFFRPGGDGSAAVTPTGALPGLAGGPAGSGPPASAADVSLSTGPGAVCRPGPDGGFELAASGAAPGDQVTVAVELVDDNGARHSQLVSAGVADAQGRATTSLLAALDGREIRACTVTAVQLGDRVVYAGR